MAYTLLALPVYSSLMSGMYQYMRTGQKPEGIDWIYPRDGGHDQFGNETRSALPTYLAKDIMGWLHDPVHEAVAGVSPPLQAGLNIAKNEDYRGRAIRNTTGMGPRHSVLGQFRDVAEYLENLYVPFSWSQTSRDPGKEGKEEWPGYLGIGHAPKWSEQSPEQREALEQVRAARPPSPWKGYIRGKIESGADLAAETEDDE